MRSIRLFNLALLLVAVLFVQDSVPAGTESLGDSDSRIAFESSTPAGYTRVTLTDNGIVWGVPTKYTTDSDAGTVAYMVLGKLKGCSFATAEAARQSKVYIKTQDLGSQSNYVSETVCGTTTRSYSSWAGARITHLLFFDESSSPNIKEAVYNAATGQIEIGNEESTVQQPDPPEQPEEPGNEGGIPTRAQDTLEGHRGSVLSVVFSPDGTMLASASLDGTVKLWDGATRENIATLEGHTEAVNSVVFSPDETMLASGADDYTIKLWDVATRENITTLEGHTEAVRSVVFSPDGTRLASASLDGTIKLWDGATRENIATLKGHTGGALSVVFSPDGTRLASASRDGTVKLWDGATRAEIATLEGHTDWVYSVVFSPDGTMLASASWDETVKLWDGATRENIATLKGHTGGALSVVFSPDGTMLASASLDGTVKLWDGATRKNIATLKGHTGGALSVVFSPDGTMLASSPNDGGTVKLWDVAEFTSTLVKISGDEQQGVFGSTLANPLVVEVRDLDNNPLPGVEVTFRVTRGEGKLSGQSTVEQVTTDANGRAEAILTLGPDRVTNIERRPDQPWYGRRSLPLDPIG